MHPLVVLGPIFWARLGAEKSTKNQTELVKEGAFQMAVITEKTKKYLLVADIAGWGDGKCFLDTIKTNQRDARSIIAELDQDIDATCSEFGITTQDWSEIKLYFAYGPEFDKLRAFRANEELVEAGRMVGADGGIEFVLLQSCDAKQNFIWAIYADIEYGEDTPVWFSQDLEYIDALRELMIVVERDLANMGDGIEKGVLGS